MFLNSVEQSLMHLKIDLSLAFEMTAFCGGKWGKEAGVALPPPSFPQSYIYHGHFYQREKPKMINLTRFM